MVLMHTNFTCFDDVERWYNQTKPLGGKSNAGLEIRPIGDRARKHERIVKVNDDCYALSDGYHRGDALFPAWTRSRDENDKATLEDMKTFAPIVWQRYGQGVETVTIRNGVGPAYHTSRYMFLDRHMPSRLSFVQTRVGRQFVRIGGVGTEVFLAKGTHVTPSEYANALAARAKQAQPVNRGYVMSWATGTEDKTSLTFRRDGARWELVNSPAALPTPPRTVVDKELKEQYREAIKTFTDWALTVAPMLNIDDFNVRTEYDRIWKDWMKENRGYEQRSWGAMRNRAIPELFRQIVDNPEHPLRVVMVVAMMYETEVYLTPIDNQARLTAARSRINSWLNQTLAFLKKV
jgi:hypothetical protein